MSLGLVDLAQQTLFQFLQFLLVVWNTADDFFRFGPFFLFGEFP